MKKIFSVLLLFIAFHSDAQVKKVSLQASGLTCSMCSNSINKALRSIAYVEKVMANIQTSTFDITFKPGARVDFDDLKAKVEDAGFSVANLTATISFDNIPVNNDEHAVINGMSFHFLHVKPQVLSGDQTVRILDKGYVTLKEYKRNEKLTRMECYKTGAAGSCCSKDGIAAGTRIYHVTIWD